jgi:putative ubiquitin-RnfH superfamily antitoxin RatB of RatAB toxin-antitoxin module
MAETTEPMIEVELIYALQNEQIVEPLQVPAGATIADAITQSGILLRYPGLVAERMLVGIYGRCAKASTVLREFDRIEIYRPLIADPRQARRARARLAVKAKR